MHPVNNAASVYATRHRKPNPRQYQSSSDAFQSAYTFNNEASRSGYSDLGFALRAEDFGWSWRAFARSGRFKVSDPVKETSLVGC